MSKQRMIRTLLATAWVALGANGTALAQPVTETLEGTINNDRGTPSVDVYSFEWNEGDKVTLDIDGPSFDQLDSVLSVVDPRGVKRDELIQQDTDPADPESECTKSSLPTCATYDSYVNEFKVNIKGLWTVSVSGNQNAGVGQYRLLVTRVEGQAPEQPEPLGIKIDIKPNNSHKVTPVKIGERHIRVALLSKTGFNPFAIHVDSLRFGPTGTESSFVRCAKRGKDRNGDRKPDRVCRFDIAKTGFTLGNPVGMVKGTTLDGRAFQGQADVRVLAQKHHKDRKHHDDDDDDD